MQKLYGLIGYPLGHSFSQKYFNEKFQREGIDDARFELFAIEHISHLPGLIASHPNLRGLSVTIPYKEQVLDYLDDLDATARSIGAVNSIRIARSGSKVLLKGFNTDSYGFSKSLEQTTRKSSARSLVLGSGGASKAVIYVLKQKGWNPLVVSRTPDEPGQIAYQDVTEALLAESRLIVNTTPLGMYPANEACPPLPYHALTPDHVLFDLVYNPSVTLFMKKGLQQGCSVKNGADMLAYQAERSWDLWNQ
ncbi:MAG: shikimate dehydrogenase [Bacteroidales bacterium]